MTVIGITGGIGAGKSVVSRILRCKGFSVYDCDAEARRLMDDSDGLKADIALRLGRHCLLGSGGLDRKAIAEVVFSDDSCREWLNLRVHGMVREDLSEFIDSCAEGILFVESAILRTGGLLQFCDAIWLVDTPEVLRVRRASRRDGTDEQSVLKRIKAQATEFSGFDNLRVVKIMNDGSRSLLKQIDNQLKTL